MNLRGNISTLKNIFLDVFVEIDEIVFPVTKFKGSPFIVLNNVNSIEDVFLPFEILVSVAKLESIDSRILFK